MEEVNQRDDHGGRATTGGKEDEEEEKREKEEEDERVQVAPNIGADGSHPQVMSDLEEGERGTRKVRWADCDDEEGKEEEDQETEAE